MGKSIVCPRAQLGSLFFGHRICGGARGMGTPWPGMLTWMGWGRVPSWLQRAARGRPKRAPLLPEPDDLGTSAAAEVPRRTKGQGKCSFHLPRIPPAAKERTAKRCRGEAPGERSRTLSALSPRCRKQGRDVVWEGGALGAQLSPAAEPWGWTCPAGKAAAAAVQHEWPPARGEGPSCRRLLQTHQPRGQVHLGCQRGREVAAAWDQPARNVLRSLGSPAADRAPGELCRPLALCERWRQPRPRPERSSPLPGPGPASPRCWHGVSSPGQGEKSRR